MKCSHGAVLALVIVMATAGCTPHPVGPARTLSKYEGKAATTAESALSAVETVRLAADTADAGHAFGPYLSQLVSEQEESLSGLQGTFDSIQPPDEQADELRGRLDELLSSALEHVGDVRIAVRRGAFDEAVSAAEPLADDADALRQFTEEHQS